ncbi:MAG TPA: cell division protein ZapA [Flavobacteriales bacterium]|nr:cell division protein ZapA [Flavobacteriales bacterium]
MTEKVKIKVSIAGRIYPLKVTAEEEAHVRQAVKFIEERVQVIEKQYAIKDIQDIQALILLELASELNFLKEKQQENEQLVLNKVNQLLQL